MPSRVVAPPPSPPVEAISVAPPSAPGPRSLELSLSRRGEVVAVSVTLSGWDEAPVLVMADAHEGETGFARRITKVAARDGTGEVAMTHERSRGSTGEVLATYRAGRVPTGDLVVTYDAKAADTVTTGLRAFGGAAAGLGATFLLLPAAVEPIELRVRGESLHTSLPATTLTAAPGRLRSTMFAWGDVRVREAPRVRGVFVGDRLEVDETLAFAGQVLGDAGAMFGEPTHPVTLFSLPSLGPNGMLRGAAQPGALVVQTGGRAPHPDLLRLMVTHELLHQWIGIGVRIAGREGTRHWFSEGFTVHFARELLFQSGRLGLRAFAEDVGVSTHRYFTNPFRTASNRAIADLMHAEPTHERLPYDRGSLLALELDARVREASQGERSLVDVVKALLARAEKRGPSPDGARFVELADIREVVRELGGESAEQRMLAVAERGDDPDPPDGALGPCLRRVPRTYEIGLVKVQGFAWHVEADRGEACRRRKPSR